VRYLFALACALLVQLPGVSAADDNRPILAAPSVSQDQVTVPPPPLKPGQAVRVGGSVPEPRKTKHVAPTFPKSARGLSGVVVAEFLIGTNGRVRDVRLLRSAPPFDKATIAAVKQWRYEPTRFLNTPVSLLRIATVEFKDGIASVAVH